MNNRSKSPTSNFIDITENTEQKYIHFMKKDKEADLNFVQMGHHITSPDYSYGPIVRNHYLLHFIRSGKGFFIIHNQRYEISAGACFLIEPQQIAFYQSDKHDPWEYYWVGFCGYHAPEYIEQIGFSYNTPVLTIPSSINIFTEFQRIDEIGYSEDNYLAYCAALYYVLHYMSRKSGGGDEQLLPGKKNPFQSDVVETIITLIQNSYHTHLLVNEIARQLSVDRGYLCKVFKSQTGTPIKSYLTNYRLNVAAKLLRNRNKSIERIALEVGLSDQFYFSRLFKIKYGLSPREYRKQL